MRAIEKFLKSAGKAEKELYDILHGYAKRKASDWQQRYVLADAVRKCISGGKLKTKIVQDIAAYAGISQAFIGELLAVTKRVSREKYKTLFQTAEKNGIVLHWSLVHCVALMVRYPDQREILFDMITTERVTYAELREGILLARVSGRAVSEPLPHHKWRQLSSEVNLQLSALRRKIGYLNVDTASLTEEQEGEILEGLDQFLIEFEDISTTEIPKLAQVRDRLAKRVDSRSVQRIAALREMKQASGKGDAYSRVNIEQRAQTDTALIKRACSKLWRCCGTVPTVGLGTEQSSYVIQCPQCGRKHTGSLGTAVYDWNYAVDMQKRAAREASQSAGNAVGSKR